MAQKPVWGSTYLYDGLLLSSVAYIREYLPSPGWIMASPNPNKALCVISLRKMQHFDIYFEVCWALPAVDKSFWIGVRFWGNKLVFRFWRLCDLKCQKFLYSCVLFPSPVMKDLGTTTRTRAQLQEVIDIRRFSTSGRTLSRFSGVADPRGTKFI